MSASVSYISDEENFLRVVESNSGVINKICYYYCQDAEDFGDLRQDVLANMWANRMSFRGESSVSTWIYRIALNTCISALRSRKKRGKSVGLDSLKEFMADNTDITALHAEMNRLISRLSAEEKAIVLLWLDNVSYEGIAEIVGCSRNTLATRLRRIKEKIVKMSES